MARKCLNEVEIEKLKSAFKRKNRDTLFLELLFNYGMRTGELLNLKGEDISLEEKTFFIKGTKNSNSRTFPIKNEELFNRLKSLMKGPKDRIFNFHRQTAFRIWHNYRTTNLGLHSLRHTFALSLVEKGTDIRIVQKILGHKRIETTMIYVDLVDTKKAFDQIFVA